MAKQKELWTIFFIGAAGYPLLEILWRGYTHWSMALTGGVCFLFLYLFSLWKPQLPLWKKSLAGALIITGIEFVSGLVFNILFRMNVWDYSAYPLNLFGQVCLLYSALWFLLCFFLFSFCSYLQKRLNVVRE